MVSLAPETDNPQPRAEEPPEDISAISSALRLIALGLVFGFLVWSFGWPVLWIISGLVFAIFLHELGHYLAARRAGMKVTDFFIGFGPMLGAFRRGETRYGLRAIPAGAYVKVLGMSNLDEVDPSDEPRTYRQATYLERMSVALAGSFMHFVQAAVFIAIFLSVVGAPRGGLFDYDAWSIDEVVADSGAQRAGLLPGDEIMSVNGNGSSSFEDLAAEVGPRAGETVQVTVRRDDEVFDVAVDVAASDTDPDRGLIGVIRGLPTLEQRSPVAAIAEVPRAMYEGTSQVVGFLGSFLSPSGIANFVDLIGEANAPEPTTSAAPPSETVDGPDETLRPVSILGIIDIGKDASPEGLLQLMIALNLFVGWFNLIPLLPFDGGHAVIATYEKVREVLRGGTERYIVDLTKLLPLTYMVVFALVGLGLSTIYLDLVDPVGS